MGDFDFVKLNQNDLKLLVIMKTNDSPFDYVDEIQEQFKESGFSGMFIIDELLHSGNTDERFIVGFFDGNCFDNSQFNFKNIEKKSIIRSYICELLRSDTDILSSSSLTERQQNLISHGCVI